jgi:hypothetical protein
MRKLDTFLENELTSNNEGTSTSSFSDQTRKRQRRIQPLQPDPSIAFQDFRAATVLKHPNFAFLGPASMAVYWFKIYLKSPQFGWIHHNNPSRKDRRKKTPFCHIPGQYLLRPLFENQQKETQLDSYSVEEVLERGTPGIHYAPSYVGVYNMVRKFGKFGLDDNGDIVLVDYAGPHLHSMDQNETA